MEFKIGDMILILDAGNGAKAYNNRIGIVTEEKNAGGLCPHNDGFNLFINDYYGICRVNKNGIYKKIDFSDENFCIITNSIPDDSNEFTEHTGAIKLYFYKCNECDYEIIVSSLQNLKHCCNCGIKIYNVYPKH